MTRREMIIDAINELTLSREDILDNGLEFQPQHVTQAILEIDQHIRTLQQQLIKLAC